MSALISQSTQTLDGSPRFVFFGTPAFAAISLHALIDAGMIPQAVVTMPDRPAGRGRKVRVSPVKQSAELHDLTIFQPHSMAAEQNQELIQLLASCDLGVVVAYGHIMPQSLLALPRYGCINVHASLLPRWRGAAPIQRAILAGDRTTGISIMQMEQGLDTGPVLFSANCPIETTDTGRSMHDRLALLGGTTLTAAMQQLPSLTPQPQDDSKAQYAAKIHKQDGCIDWRQSTDHIDRTIRAFCPVPVAWTDYQQQRIRIWQAQPLNDVHSCQPGTVVNYDDQGLDIATGDSTIRLLQLQLAGSTPRYLHQLFNGYRDLFRSGAVLGQSEC